MSQVLVLVLASLVIVLVLVLVGLVLVLVLVLVLACPVLVNITGSWHTSSHWRQWFPPLIGVSPKTISPQFLSLPNSMIRWSVNPDKIRTRVVILVTSVPVRYLWMSSLSVATGPRKSRPKSAQTLRVIVFEESSGPAFRSYRVTVSARMAAGLLPSLARRPGTLSRIISGIRTLPWTTSSACWKRFCSQRTSAISALDVSRRCAL